LSFRTIAGAQSKGRPAARIGYGGKANVIAEPREERAPLLPDLLATGLDIIFVGAAPSHWSADIGHYYAGPTNRFWLTLYKSGFTPRLLLPEEDTQILQYGIGLTGIYRQLSTSANHLLPTPTGERRARLREKLRELSPKYICYNGKDAYRLCTGKTWTDWGEQAVRQGEPRVFVAISSSGRADGWSRERLEQYRELKRLVDEARSYCR
jgi:double-stranded uracil-DNA glycosylase